MLIRPFFQPSPLPPVEEQKKAGAYSKHTPLKGSKASKKGEDKTSQKKLFEEDTSLLKSVTSGDLAALNSGGSDYQSCASFSGTLDAMELTCLPPTTPDNQAGAVGDKKKSWADLDEEDTFLLGPDLNSIAEEKTLEEEETIEEEVTMSFIFPPGLASSLFWPIHSLSGNNFPYLPDNFPDKCPLPLSSSIPPFIYFRQYNTPQFSASVSNLVIFLVPAIFQQISQSATINLTQV